MVNKKYIKSNEVFKSLVKSDSSDGYYDDITEYTNALLRTQSNLQLALEALRACHWSMEGKRFISVHPFFDELFDILDNEVDFFAEYLALNNVPPVSNFNHVTANDELSSDEPDGFISVDTGVFRACNILGGLEEQVDETYIYAGTVNDHRIQSHIDNLLESLDHYVYFFRKEFMDMDGEDDD